VFHVPSILDSATGQLHTLEAKSFWGCIYRKYINATVADVANALRGEIRGNITGA